MRNVEDGYSLLTIATALLLTGIVIIGSMYLLQNYNIIPKNVQVVPTTINQNTDTDSSMMEGTSTKEIDPTKGIIQGTYIFPSEGIPDTLIPCAENTTTKEVICSASVGESGQKDSFMIIVPVGSYYVYATNTADPNMYKAYYTEFVTCGLLAACPSHKKIEVEVTAGETVSDIKPHDWYDPSEQP